MFKRLRPIIRWHIEKHILKYLLTSHAINLNPNIIAETWAIPPLDEDWKKNTAKKYIAYCFGVGEDIELEKYLIKYLDVYTFDPTPRAIHYIKINHLAEQFNFNPIGVWNKNTKLKFYSPDNPNNVSHSILDKNTSKNYFEAECKNISTIMKENGHDNLFLLKMNIEGVEHLILDNIILEKIFPKIIMLTYEGDYALIKALKYTKILERNGYNLYSLSGWAITYLRNSQ